MKIKFKKTYINDFKYFLSECEEYKVVNYGDHIFMFKKIDCKHNGKKYRAFGNSVEHDSAGNSVDYKTYRNAFRKLNNLIGAKE